jgi:hypothetical protein
MRSPFFVFCYNVIGVSTDRALTLLPLTTQRSRGPKGNDPMTGSGREHVKCSLLSYIAEMRNTLVIFLTDDIYIYTHTIQKKVFPALYSLYVCTVLYIIRRHQQENKGYIQGLEKPMPNSLRNTCYYSVYKVMRDSRRSADASGMTIIRPFDR